MDKIRNLIIFIIKNLKDKKEATPGYIKRVIYLIDWESCLIRGETLTNINWIKDEDGISIEYLDNIINKLLDTFKVNKIVNSLNYLSLLNPSDRYNFEEDELKIIKAVWKKIGNKNYEVLASKVFGTYPYKYYSSKKCQNINLIEASKKFKNLV